MYLTVGPRMLVQANRFDFSGQPYRLQSVLDTIKYLVGGFDFDMVVKS